MIQIGIDVDPLDIYLLRTDVLLVTVSVILALTIFSSSLIVITLTSTYIRATLNLKKLRWKIFLIAGLIIGATLYWIIMMELFYNSSGYNHWIFTGGGYSPYFGVIGPFIGASLIIIGAFAKRD